TTKQIIEKLNVSGIEIEDKKNQILSLLENFSAIAQENAASTEEVSASTEELNASIAMISDASENLSALAQQLREEISKFKV
ncbi:MAG: methyl-accepting chemotaxis protein, partial [Peptococcaceae bacterium]|nr:methyl-accepting chemotaxis protein [Peptococcaceae bacterium]